MKNYAILFDLHDTLIQSREAWLRAFKYLRPNEYGRIRKMYDKPINRKKICEIYSIDYTALKKEYQNYLREYKCTIFVLKRLSNLYKIIILSNASKNRIIEDLSRFELSNYIFKIYSKEDGMKPNENYIQKIIAENHISRAIMIGNNYNEDVLNLNNIDNIIITNVFDRILLWHRVQKKIKKWFI